MFLQEGNQINSKLNNIDLKINKKKKILITMAKMNPRGNNLFNLKSFNELKKDQTNIKIFKNSSFDSNFNSVQSLNTNLSLPKHLLLPNHSPISLRPNAYLSKGETEAPFSNLSWRGGDPKERSFGGDRIRSNKNIKNPKFSAILRAIRSIRLNRDEWKLIRYINLMEKKLRSNPPFGCFPSTSSSISSSNILSSEGPTLPQPPKEPYLSPNIIEAPALGPLGERRSYVFSGSFSNRVQDNPLLTKGGINVEKETKNFYIKQNNKNFTYTNIISKNLLLQNMKYNFLKSTLSSILKKKIRSISEILEDKPIKNYVLYSYLKNCIFTPPHLNITALDSNTSPLGVNAEAGSKGGISKLSLNKYKGRKFGSFINYNKIIGYKFNSTFYQAYPKNRGNIYIKDTYKLLFYLFKSMYCLISKPVLKYTNDKVTIQLFYYLNIPKKKVFRLFSISYINSIKNKWLALIEKKKTNYINPSSPQLGQL